jgi:hypothetical protein
LSVGRKSLLQRHPKALAITASSPFIEEVAAPNQVTVFSADSFDTWT